MFYKLLFISLLFLASIIAGIVTGQPLPDEPQTGANTIIRLEALEDPTHRLTLPQVMSPEYAHQFHPVTQPTPNFGYSSSSWWLRFDMVNLAEKSWYLLLDQPTDSKPELFAFSSAGNPVTFKPLPQYRTPAWKFEPPSGERLTFYLRVTAGKRLLQLPLKLLNQDAFLAHSNHQYMFFALITGGMIILAIHNLLLFSSLKESGQLSLVLFILCVLFLFYHDANLLPSLIPLDVSYGWSHPLALVLGIAAAFSYWRSVNQQANFWLEQFLKWAQWGVLLASPVILGVISHNIQLLYLLALASIPILLVFITHTAISGHAITRNTYWAGISILVAAFIYALPRTGWPIELPINSIYVGQSGIVLGLVLISISQAERTRMLRSQAERAEAVNEARGEFLATMSHELRTPIHAVIGIGKLLREMASTVEQRHYLNKLETASHHLLDLINNVLDLARLENQQQVFAQETHPFRLHDLLNELDSLFSAEVAQKKLRLNIHTPVTPLPPLMGDSKWLRQILANLLGNAINYTEKGQVDLHVTLAQPREPGMQTLTFSIRDTGIGIPYGQQDKVFQPFYQISSGHSRRQGGSGLGLAISQQLVRQMGGELAVESIPGQGSQFFFTLRFPVQAGTPETAAPPPLPITDPPMHSLANLNILLVDDDELNLMISAKLLGNQGARVITAESGAAAIRQLGEQAVDIVLMDVSMPGMDGYETTRRIRVDTRWRELPIIALTAQAIAGERERCLAAGMDNYLTKPFRLEELVETIRKACEQPE